MTANPATASNRDRIRTLLKGIETGDPESVTVVDEERYVQHNPTTAEGSIGLAELFSRLARTEPRVEIVRIFEDGDFVFGHVEYDFATEVTGFEVFRFEDGFAVEHWDNLQPKPEGPNRSGHTTIDGPTAVVDLDRTEANRNLVRSYVEQVLLDGDLPGLPHHVNESAGYVEHDPAGTDGVESLHATLAARLPGGDPVLHYQRIHRILAEGCFVLAACEGSHHGVHAALYDLFRVDSGAIVEHWNSIEEIPPRSEWKNTNGKF